MPSGWGSWTIIRTSYVSGLHFDVMNISLVPRLLPVFLHGEEPGYEANEHSCGAGDFRIWTRFLRKYVYFRVIRLDFNPWATADLL